MANKEEIRYLREQGLTHREIAERCGVSRQYSAYVCGITEPMNYSPVGKECVYPNLRKWMNKHQISRLSFLKRMGIDPHYNNYARFSRCIRGEYQPRKDYIDKMLAVTGFTYEEMFYTEEEE